MTAGLNNQRGVYTLCPPEVGTRPKWEFWGGGVKQNAHVCKFKGLFIFFKAVRKNARTPFCVFACQLRAAHARVSARQCVCCRLSQSVCVQGVYLYKGIVGVLDLWGSRFKRREPPLFHPLIHVAAEAFSLKLNKRGLDNGSRQSGSFVCALNLSATFLPFIPSFFHLCHFLSLSGPVPVRPSKFLLPPPPRLAHRAFDYLEPAVWRCLIPSCSAVKCLSAIVGVGEFTGI